MKKSLIKTFISSMVVAGMLSCSMIAYSASIDDVARVARELGYPEDVIQQGYNRYYANPEEYTSEGFDKAIEELYKADGAVLTTASQIPLPETTTTTAINNTTANTSNSTTVPAKNENNTDNVIGGITLSTADGSKFTRISEEEFIKLSYDEKMSYIRSFTPEQQQVIFDNLSPEEHKSLLKQLPVEQKAQIADSMASFAETFDLNVSVDEITDDNLSISMRNSDGELVGVANAGVLVEDTGYDRRGIFALSAGLITVAGILLVTVSKLFRTGREK